MNAPTDPMLEQQQLELIPLTSIAPAPTAVQARRRARITPESIAELADSIRTQGLLQPLLVRRLPALRGLAAYELVAGERRWRAAELAGLAHAPCLVRQLNDAQVLEAQLVENLQRADLDPLEEAEGYRELRALTGLSAAELGARIGKSRSWVYARLQLLELDESVRTEIAERNLDVSKALLVARFKSARLQKKALDVLRMNRDYGVRRSAEDLGRRVMVSLERAPFALDDERPIEVKLARGVTHTFGACAGCPQNSANDPELVALLTESDKRHQPHCLERACYDAKCTRATDEARAAATAAGRTVIAGEEAAKILPYYGPMNGYVDLDEQVDDDDVATYQALTGDREPEDYDAPEHEAWEERWQAWTAPTWRELLGGPVPAERITLIEHPREKGRLVQALSAQDLRELVKARGVEVPEELLPEDYKEPRRPKVEKRESPAEEKARVGAQQKAAEEEQQYRLRLLREIHARWKPPVKRQDLELVADALFGEPWELNRVRNSLQIAKPIRIPTMSDAELWRLIVASILEDQEIDRGSAGDKPGRLLAYCQRLKIDAKALRNPEAKPAPAKGKAKAAAAKKPATKKAKKKVRA